jgi:dTMP kinase
MSDEAVIEAIQELTPETERAAHILRLACAAQSGSEFPSLVPVPEERMPHQIMYRLPGRLITLEGGDGTGKTTAGNLLAHALEERGIHVERMREPGGTPTGEKIRTILLNKHDLDIKPITEAFLFAAARAENGALILHPALSQGAWVLVDRFLDSSIAYQGHGRGLGIEEIALLSRWALDGLWPTRTLLLEISNDEALRRREARRLTENGDAPSSNDRIEQSGDEFMAKVMEGYRICAEKFPERVIPILADGTPEEVTTRCLVALADLF